MDPSHIITMHARVRYVERVLDIPLARLAARDGVDPEHDGHVWTWGIRNGLIDTGKVEAALATGPIIAAAAIGAKSVDLGNGCRAVIDDGRVITILRKSISCRLLKEKHATRNRRADWERSRGFKDRRDRERNHDHA